MIVILIGNNLIDNNESNPIVFICRKWSNCSNSYFDDESQSFGNDITSTLQIVGRPKSFKTEKNRHNRF